MKADELIPLLVTGAGGGALGWILRTASSLTRNEREFLAGMQKEIADLRKEDHDCSAKIEALNQLWQQKYDSLYQQVIQLTRENGTLSTQLEALRNR